MMNISATAADDTTTMRKLYRTSPDDIDRSDGAPQLLFDRASKNLELIVAREDKGRHDEHSYLLREMATTMKGGNKMKESGGEERKEVGGVGVGVQQGHRMGAFPIEA
jgi:hypothetical protein